MFWTWCKLQPIASEERCNVGWLWLIRGLMANRTLQLSNYKWHWIPEQECMQHAQLRRKDLIFLMFCSVVFEAQLVTKDYLIWDGTNITFLWCMSSKSSDDDTLFDHCLNSLETMMTCVLFIQFRQCSQIYISQQHKHLM